MQLRAGDPEAIGGYTLRARLGAGGMGTVFLAHTPSGRPVAIKLIHQQFLDDDEFRIRFRQEVAAARRVSGAFTAAVVDADTEGDHPWMATTYITGPTLAQRINEGGALSGPELRTLAIGLVEALRDIHRAGVVHRDLKPSNVVLSPEGPRVIDFGISRATDQKTLTMTGRIIGTPPFMSPEQLQAPREVGTESDVFSVATLLVYAATGQGPFDADSPYMTAYQVVHEAPVLGQVPAPLRAVVERCLDKNRSRRPNADELLQQLRTLPENLTAPPGASAAAAGARSGSGNGAQGAPGGVPGNGSVGADFDTRLLSGKVRARLARAGLGRAVGARRRPRAQPSDDRAMLATHAMNVPVGTGADSAARVGSSGPAGSGSLSSGHHPAFSARGLRRRWRTVVAVAAAVAAISTGVTLLATDGGEPRARDGSVGADGETRGSVTVAQAPPPKGFKPWEETVRGSKITDELRCVPQEDTVYCGGGGVLAARLRAADGTLVWQRTSPGVPVQGVYMVGVVDGTVIGYRIPADSSAPWQMTGLSTADGTTLWSAPASDGSAVFTGQPQDAALLGTTVFSVDVARTKIEARQARTGELRWSTPFPAGSACIPVVAAAHAYAMCAPQAEVAAINVAHPSLRTLDPGTGALGRPTRVDGALRTVGAAADGSLVALEEHRLSSGFDGYTRIVRFDPRTARVTSSPVRRYSGSTPGMAGGMLYFAGDEGLIHAVDPATGKQKWSAQTSVESPSGPVLSHGVLYFSSSGGRVVALDARSGRVRWSTNPRTRSNGSDDMTLAPRVAVAQGALVVTARDNRVFSFAAAKPPKAP